MSLFSSLGQGDIWSLSGISFASPVNDILDKEFYTLEELLEEDDLLQEVKSKNERLLTFLQTEEVVEKLVEFVVISAEEGASEVRVYKYPYIACELFCCEVQKILDILVESQDGKFLQYLFSLLDHDAPLDHYLAGYFEKILEMLFRRMTVPVMKYLNDGGIPLLQKFLNHIENYSVMQIVQRVMLPHIPFSMDDDEMPPEEKLSYQCNWSFQRETCYLLCSRMLSGGSHDIPSHISDLLITVLQLSPHDSLFLTHLCEPRCLDDMLKFSFQDYDERASIVELPSIEANLSLASISVLESLISRLCETMNPFENGEDENNMIDDSRKTMLLIGECVDKVSAALIAYIPQLSKQLKSYTENDVCGTFEAQSGASYRRLGQRGLQLVKLVEAVVRLANDNIDAALCTSGALKACVDLMFQFKLNSLLHLSVQRIILILIEGGATERWLLFFCHFKILFLTYFFPILYDSTIHCLLVECGLLKRIIEIVSEESSSIGEDVTEDREKGENCCGPLIGGSRRPIVGHVISIAQSIVGAMQAERIDADSSIDVSQDLSSDDGLDRGENQEQSQQPTVVKNVLTQSGLYEEWIAFVQDSLQHILDRQSAYGNVDNDTSTDSAKMSQMEATLEALNLKDNAWLKQHDDDIQNNIFDDEDEDSDDDENSDDDDDDDYHNYSNFSSQIKVTAVVKDDHGVEHNMVDFEDDDFEIGDQFPKFDMNYTDENFADFGSTNSSATFEANFDSVPEAKFEATFDSQQFDSSASFEANFENVQLDNDDFFADFPKQTSAKDITSEGSGGKP